MQEDLYEAIIDEIDSSLCIPLHKTFIAIATFSIVNRK